jgi:hypothetical protein
MAEANKLAFPPIQITEGDASVIKLVGVGTTFIVAEAFPIQPLVEVPTTE